MNKHTVSLLFLLLSILNTGETAAQTCTASVTTVVADKCLLSTNTSPSAVSMTLSTSVAGSSVTPVSNSNMYLKVTSIVPSGTTRKITAIISNGTIPTGTILTLAPAACTSANSEGTLGAVVTAPITLNKTSNQAIINSIGSCYTGTSTTDGYNLTYTWKPNDTNYYLITATSGSTTVTVTFTIANN
jgi:hypothetical protein